MGKCTVCGEEMNRLSIMRHMKKKHDLNTFIIKDSGPEKSMCTICGEMRSNRIIVRHTARCMGGLEKKKSGGQKVDKNLSCNSCKRHFINEKQMKNHECAHLQCDLCDAKFMRIRNLEVHMKGHEGHELFPCDKCEGLFLLRKRCLRHMRTAHDPAYQVRKFKCNQCDSDFKNKPDLNKHIKRLHMGLGKNFKCEECNKAYQRRSQLLVHMHYKHTKHMFVKKCPDCDLELLSHGEYKAHREMRCKVLKKKSQVEESVSAVASIQFEMKVI